MELARSCAPKMLIIALMVLAVRRQGFWERLPRDLAESLAHLFVDFKRLDCGIASAVV